VNTEAFDALPTADAEALLLEWCACERWARDVAAARPFGDRATLVERARALWRTADEPELLAAFAAHPRIGDVEHLRRRFGRANAEQGQVLAAEDAVLERLKTLNDTYLERFGFIFIVCATGKSAAEMLALLEARIDQPRAAELATAAREQEAIMVLRLEQAIDAPSDPGVSQ
jgi:2-oxo-4-hydroxy-4-carboxy-5-ureidoimidazoline decarboxylase